MNDRLSLLMNVWMSSAINWEDGLDEAKNVLGKRDLIKDSHLDRSKFARPVGGCCAVVRSITGPGTSGRRIGTGTNPGTGTGTSGFGVSPQHAALRYSKCPMHDLSGFRQSSFGTGEAQHASPVRSSKPLRWCDRPDRHFLSCVA